VQEVVAQRDENTRAADDLRMPSRQHNLIRRCRCRVAVLIQPSGRTTPSHATILPIAMRSPRHDCRPRVITPTRKDLSAIRLLTPAAVRSAHGPRILFDYCRHVLFAMLSLMRLSGDAVVAVHVRPVVLA